MKVKSGDEVKVIRGKDKGKMGKIEKVFTKTNSVLVTGINLYKRHVKKRLQNQKSEIITIAKPLPVTNVVLVCPSCHLGTRVGFKVAGDKKIRICRKCEKEL